MRCVDLFSGAGGLSLGAQQAGFRIAVAVEKEPNAAMTYQRNFPDTKLIRADIKDVSIDDIGYVDVILAGPPCQSFSTSNQRTRSDTNPFNDYLFEPLRFAALLRPDYLIIENVRGLAIGTRRRYLDRLCEQLSRLSYSSTVVPISGTPSRPSSKSNKIVCDCNPLPCKKGLGPALKFAKADHSARCNR